METVPPLRRTLIVVSCGAAKIWKRRPETGNVPAREAYTSSLFRLCRRYAESVAVDRWVILSAKYGFLDPNRSIEDYNTVITDVDAIDVEALRAQWIDGFTSVEHVTSLCGRAYDQRLRAAVPVHVVIENPLAGRDLFERMAWLKQRSMDCQAGQHVEKSTDSQAL